jgi:filamentous hemagglutinin
VGDLEAAVAGDVGARGTTGFVSDASVVSHGKVIARGTIDVRPTVEAIETGQLAPRDTFLNREGLLPSKPSGYYQEFVQPTPGVSGAGPQRIVRGQGGELYYTPDHYKTFIRLN